MSPDLLSEFEGTEVLIIGDLMLDAHWHGIVDRISPEAPVPVVNVIRKENRLGGAGNVALNLKPFRALPLLCSVIGSDDHAEFLLSELKDQGLSCQGIIQSKSRPTTVKTRVWAKGQQLVRLDKEITDDLSIDEENQLLECIVHFLNTRKIEVILFQDYNKGVLTKSLINKIIKEALKREIPTVVDPKKRNFWEYKQVTLFKPNLGEIKNQVSIEAGSNPNEHYDKLAEQVIEGLDPKKLMITLSDKGIYYRDQFSKGVIPAKVRYVADVCGAGDTVVSIAALGIAKGWALEDIAILSNLAGGLVCEASGVVPVDPDRLAREYKAMVSED